MKLPTRIIACMWILLGIWNLYNQVVLALSSQSYAVLSVRMGIGILFVYFVYVWPAISLLKREPFGWWIITVESIVCAVLVAIQWLKTGPDAWRGPLVTVLLVLILALLVTDRPSRWLQESTGTDQRTEA